MLRSSVVFLLPALCMWILQSSIVLLLSMLRMWIFFSLEVQDLSFNYDVLKSHDAISRGEFVFSFIMLGSQRAYQSGDSCPRIFLKFFFDNLLLFVFSILYFWYIYWSDIGIPRFFSIFFLGYFLNFLILLLIFKFCYHSYIFKSSFLFSDCSFLISSCSSWNIFWIC